MKIVFISNTRKVFPFNKCIIASTSTVLSSKVIALLYISNYETYLQYLEKVGELESFQK